jgi:hypothetical protein
VTLGDFDADGIADLVSANSESNNVSVLMGNGNGTFRPAEDFSVGSEPHSVVVGDFNGDARQDLAVANAESDNVSILIGKVTAHSTPPSTTRSEVIRSLSSPPISMETGFWIWQRPITAVPM